jgi:hypothetical protein
MSGKFVQGNWLLPNEINANKQSKYSLDFNGSDYIVIDDDPLKNGATNFTLSAWVKADGTVGSVDRSFLQNWNGGSAPVTFLIRYKDDGNFQLYLNPSKRIDVALSSLGLVNNNWNHIVIVNEYDNSKIKVYVNGTLKHTETSVQVAYPSNSTPLGIGGNYNYWDGQIDEVCIFTRALSAPEVNSLWNSGTPGNPFDLSGDPVAYYKLGETAIFQNTGNEGNIFQIPNHAQTQLAWQGLPKLAWDGGKGGNGQNLGTVHTISFWINNNFQSNSSYRTASWFAFRQYNGGIQTSGSGSIQDRGIIYGNNWSNTDNNMPASGNYITYRTGSNSSTDNMQFPLGSIDLLNNESYNIIFVRDGGSVKCFINGQEIENPVGSINASFELLYNYISNTTFYSIQLGWEGVMTNLAIWKSDKESEVANIYNNGEPQPDYISTPDIWYKLDNTTTSYPSQYKRSINSSLSSESYVKSYLQQPYYNGAGGTAYHTYSILDSDLNLGTSYSFSFWMGFRTDRENFFGYYNKENVYYLGTTPGNSNTSGILEQDAFSQSGNSGGGVYGLKFTLYDSNGNTTGHMNFLNSGTPSWNDAYDGELHNYIFVKDGQTVSFYFDNQLVAQNSMPGELSNTILHNINGTNGGNTLARTNMTTSADWGFFANKVLTASEISTIYNNGEPGDISSTSPTIWYSYDNIDVVSEKLIDKGSEGTNASILRRDGVTMGLGGVVNGSNIKYRDGIQSTGNASLTSTDLGLYSPLYSQFSTFFPGGSYIDTGFKIPSSYTKYSYSLWFKTTNTSTSYAALVGSTTSGNNVDCRGVLYLHNTNLGVLTGDGTVDYLNTFDVSSLLLDSNWHHIAATFIEGEIKVFIDGSLEQTFTSSNIKIAESTTNSFIGSMALFWKLTNSFINEVAIFDRQLSNNEITSIYNNGKPTSLASHSPDQWWRLGDTGYATTTSPTSTLTYPNEISGKSDGITNASMQPSINADAPKVVAPGYSSGLVQLDKKGDAPNSTSNSISYNILKTNQSVYTPKYVSQYTVDNNYSMAFEATDYFSLGSSIDLGQTNTISFWVYYPANGFHIITGDPGLPNSYNIFLNNGNSILYRTTTGQNTWFVTPTLNDWTHLVFTKNDTDTYGKLYFNGVEQPIGSGSQNIRLGFTKISSIGAKPDGTTGFVGKLDEFAAWDKELTADQIKFDIYEASTTANKSADFINNPNLPNPVVWYRMGD